MDEVHFPAGAAVADIAAGIVVVVLAAGRGERFAASGGTTHKLDALLQGKRVLDHVLDAVRASGLAHHVVRADPLRPGMGDSIAAGVRATAGARGWLILPGDLPLISAATLKALAQALRIHDVVVPVYRGERGHPVGFSTVCKAELERLSGEQGAARVVRMHGPFELPVDDPGCVTDVDTLDDLARVERLLNPS